MNELSGFEQLYRKIKLISNKNRFKILLLTQEKQLNITEISQKLKLSYTKTADYITMLEKEGLVVKTKEGKETKIRSNVVISNQKIEFT